MWFPLETIVAWAKRKGFVYPWSDIYGGLANAWDYGPYGVQLKKNIQDLRWQTFVQERSDMIGMDAQILMHPKTWEASGHTENFDDPLIDDKNTGERFRADQIIEDVIGRDIEKYKKHPEKLRKIILEIGEELENKAQENTDFSDIRDKQSEIVKDLAFTTGDSLVEIKAGLRYIYNMKIPTDIEDLLPIKNLIPESWSFGAMKRFIVEFIPNNPNSWKPAEWTEVRKFEMMFYTYQGVVHDAENKIWLRPETAQGMFVNFRNVLDTTRMRVPFGIAQVGKAFRNEITPGNFLFRTREFEQMEIEYFVENDEKVGMQAFEEWKEESMRWRKDIIGFKAKNLKFREHEKDELAFYSKGTFDVEYHYPRGWGELQGVAYRTDYDLTQHQNTSGQNMQYSDPQTWKRYIPHVIEPSFGLSRTVLAAMIDAYEEEKYTDQNGKEATRIVARFNKHIAPIKFAILPLIKKDEKQVEIAETLFKKLSKKYMCEYDDGGAIGKRYRRQDEIGTPFCITIDHQSCDDGTVTIRHRDSMEQERVKLEEVENFMG